jgi:hypothetical protein
MAGDPLSTIRTLTYERADISQDDARFGSTTMTNIVNSALKQVSGDFDPFWLLTSGSIAVVAGTVNYATSTLTRFRKVQRIVDDLNYELTALGKREIGRYQRFTSKPQGYHVEEGSIKLLPVSDAAYTYTVHYYQNEIPLASDNDQPALPVEYTDFLVVRAALICARKIKDAEAVANMKEEIVDWKKRIADDLRQMKGNPRIVLRDENVWV